MDYAKKLAKRVLARNPRNAIDSIRILSEVLEEEGYVNPDAVLAQLKADVAKAAIEILIEENRKKAS